jgi:hypothetical protein
MLSTRRYQTSWLGSFIAQVRTDTAPLIHSVCEAVLLSIQEDLKQAGWDPSQGTYTVKKS